jgi:hypothetical protein
MRDLERTNEDIRHGALASLLLEVRLNFTAVILLVEPEIPLSKVFEGIA